MMCLTHSCGPKKRETTVCLSLGIQSMVCSESCIHLPFHPPLVISNSLCAEPAANKKIDLTKKGESEGETGKDKRTETIDPSLTFYVRHESSHSSFSSFSSFCRLLSVCVELLQKCASCLSINQSQVVCFMLFTDFLPFFSA